MPRSFAASTGLLKLRLHLSGEGRGSEFNSQAGFSAPSVAPQPVAQGAGVLPRGLPWASSCSTRLAQSCLLPPTTSSLCHEDSVQGPEGPGWTLARGLPSGLGKLLCTFSCKFLLYCRC